MGKGKYAVDFPLTSAKYSSFSCYGTARVI